MPTANISCQTQQQLKKQQHHEELLKQLKLQRQLERQEQHNQTTTNNNWSFSNYGHPNKSFSTYSPLSPVVSCFVDANATPVVAFSPPLIPSVAAVSPHSNTTSLNLQPAPPLSPLTSSSLSYLNCQQPALSYSPGIDSFHNHQVLSEQPRTVQPQKPSSEYLQQSSQFIEIPSTEQKDTYSTNSSEQQNSINETISSDLARDNRDSVSCFCATSSPINALFNIICKENGIDSAENMNRGGRRQKVAVNGNSETTRPRSTRTTTPTTTAPIKGKDEKENQQR